MSISFARTLFAYMARGVLAGARMNYSETTNAWSSESPIEVDFDCLWPQYV